MKKIKELFDKIMDFSEEVSRDHVGAYAAQTAFFFMLSLIPIILLLLTLVQYTPVTKADVMAAVITVFPTSVDSLITSIVNQVYNQSTGIIPVTIIVALWSAGKGVLAMSSGLNCVYNCHETRNYFFLRIRSTVYTMMFIVVIILLLVLSVFGNRINVLVTEHIPFMKNVADRLIRMRMLITPVVSMGLALLIYKFLPNRRDRYSRQIPGAIFSMIGWLVFSWIFSVYVDIFKGFSSMYGSLTTIMLIMMWLYFCMYSILLGGVINVRYRDEIWGNKQ